MKKIAIGFWGLFFIFGSFNSKATNNLTASQINGSTVNTITSAVPFLMISPDARAGGMGDLGAASSPDASSIYWNCSKLAFVDHKFGIAPSYTPWLRGLVDDINLAFLPFYYKLDKNQTIGGSLRYFSLGDITFTDNAGNTTGQFRPNEFSLDAAYARKLGKYLSGGMAARYIYSNLTGGYNVGSSSTHAAQSGAVDVSAFYHNDEIKVGGKKSTISAGINISNIGAKMSYTNGAIKNFLPINLRIGPSLQIKLDDYNTLAFEIDANKLLIPTPPIYATDPNTGAPIIDPSTGRQKILAGEDPTRGVASGIFNSFSDAPGGYKEELREINYATGMEWWYDNQFALRCGYFYEDPTKGNRKYFTLGAGVKYTVFGLNFSYLIPTQQKNPLQNTLRFTLTFDFDDQSQKKVETPQ